MVINRVPVNADDADTNYLVSTSTNSPVHLRDKNNAILDAIDDILEINYLIENLEKEESKVDQDHVTSPFFLNSDWFSDSTKEKLQKLKSRIRRNLDTIERVARFSNNTNLHNILQEVRKDFLAIKASLREGFKLKGSLLCSSDWQSPIYASSVPIASNRLSDKIEEHIWDYKRDGHLDSIEYEESFVAEYFSHLGSKPERLRSYITNNGMAAFTTVLHWLKDELKLASKALAITPMYFENIHLGKAFFDELIQLELELEADQDSNHKPALLDTLRSHQPQIILLDAVTNCGTVQYQDFTTVIEWAKRESSQETAIVIDTTCMPAMLMPDDLLKNLPDSVTVIFVESLAKHHQFGMDVVTGGMVVIDGREELHKNFKPTRARLGTNIADTSVGSLPRPNRQRLERRLKRHSRNMNAIGKRLLEEIKEHSGIIDSISWVGDASAANDKVDWYRSPVMSISLCPQFQSVWHYQEFENKVYELACKKQLPLAFSTSFGFDISRLYVTAPSTKFEPPFLRLSVGTENQFELEKLIDTLCIASEQLAAHWTLRQKVVAKPISQKPKAQELVKNISQPEEEIRKEYQGVFAGSDGLKDYLNPENYPPTPLVELPEDLNPYKDDGVKILAKFMPIVPLMNIKSLPAFSMLSKAAQRGDLEEVSKLIESSSSNTVMSLSVMARLFGIDTTCAIVDHSLAPGLARMLQLFGIEIYKHPSIGHELFGKVKPRRDRAAQMGSQSGWYNPNQYSNPDNPAGFERWLAPQLWQQSKGELDILSCALGTCGTMVGVSKHLREMNSDLKILACCPAPGQAVPGPREESLLNDVTFNWKNIADARIDLNESDSFEASLSLLRRGIMAGPSSGMNYAGLLKYLAEKKETGTLRDLTKESVSGELTATFICCDSPLQHIEEYFKVLDESHFPSIHSVEEEFGSVQ